jgi:1-acyl-sn-glycerol-3-phosphate acyltransferase
MKTLTNDNVYYSSQRKPSILACISPGLVFYKKMAGVVLRSSRWAKRGVYTDERWIQESMKIVRALESVGTVFEIENFSVIKNMDSPCVFIGNHMSTLETFVLPCIIQPYLPVTFIVKESLITYPVFKYVMLSRDPIVVGRTNPREDFQTVMSGGVERLNKGISIVVFPQTTRTVEFDPGHFNSIGIKLAKRAGVPVIPFALRTDAWANGKKIKEFGRIHPDKPVHFCFSDPITISGSGRAEHERIIQFIREKTGQWNSE